MFFFSMLHLEEGQLQKKNFPKDGAVESSTAFHTGDTNFGEPNARPETQWLFNCFKIYFFFK